MYYSDAPNINTSTQEDYAESSVVANNEESITNIIHRLSIPAGLP